MYKYIYTFILSIFLINSCQKLPPEAEFIEKNKIEGKIVVDEKIKEKCKGTLFLIVRKGISPQPLAVKKIELSKDNKNFKITPADVLIEDLYKEFSGEIIIYAKVSKSGNPIESKESCESEPVVVKTGSKNIIIKINRYIE